MSEPSPRKPLIAYYKNKALVRGAMQLGPAVAAQATGHPEVAFLGVAVDAFLAHMSVWDTGRFRKKIQQWMVALDAAEAAIEDERMQTDDDYCHAVLSTTAIAVRSRDDKLHTFALLLTNYDRIVLAGNVQDFYDFQAIIEEMSARELQALLVLRDLERRPDRPASTQVIDEATKDAAEAEGLAWAKQIWPELEQIAMRSGIAPEQLTGFFDRLQRTGLFRQYQVWDDNKEHPWGYTTANLDALISAIAAHGA